jgi:hypothetical protein
MPLELAQIRRRVQTRLADVKRAAATRRERVAAAERAYETFLAQTATPIMNAVAQSLSAEGFAYRVSTPGNTVRMVSDRSSRTYLELRLDTTGASPQVVLEVGRERGSRVITEERPVGSGAQVDTLTEEDVLAALMESLEDLVER